MIIIIFAIRFYGDNIDIFVDYFITELSDLLYFINHHLIIDYQFVAVWSSYDSNDNYK